MSLNTRRSLLRAIAAVGGLAAARIGVAQVGSGGTGISPAPIGQAELVAGVVTLRREGQAPVALTSGAMVMQGDQIDSGEEAEVHVAFDDGGYLALRSNSSVRINRYVVTGDVSDVAAITLLKGSLRSVTGWIGKLDPLRYRIVAGTATIGVLGTDHEVVLVAAQGGLPDAEPGAHNRVNEGATVLRNAGSTLEVGQGAAAFAPKGAAPRPYATLPAFFNRLRTPQDARVETHAREVHQYIEGRLRQRGRLNPGERFEQYRERVKAGAVRRAEGGTTPHPRTAAGQMPPAQLAHEQRRDARDAREARRLARAAKQHPAPR